MIMMAWLWTQSCMINTQQSFIAMIDIFIPWSVAWSPLTCMISYDHWSWRIIFIALAMIIYCKPTLFIDIIYEHEVHAAMNTKLKKNDKLVPFQLVPNIWFGTSWKGTSWLFFFNSKFIASWTSCSYIMSMKNVRLQLMIKAKAMNRDHM